MADTPATASSTDPSSDPIVADYTPLHETSAPASSSGNGSGNSHNANANSNSYSSSNISSNSNSNNNKQLPSPSTSPRSLRKSYSYLNQSKKLIVFVASSKYQWPIAVLLLAPLAALLVSIILFDVQRQEEFRNSSRLWILSWLFILVVIVYMAVLPRQVDVRSNGTVAIKTCLLTFHIDGIARARFGPGSHGCGGLLRPAIRFGTSLDPGACVVLLRHGDKWDVVVTPTDPQGFGRAVEEMLRTKEEAGRDEALVSLEGGPRPAP